MDDTSQKTILQQIGEVVAAAPAATKAVLLAPDRWSTLCDETGADRDAVLVQHRVLRPEGEVKVLITKQGPIA